MGTRLGINRRAIIGSAGLVLAAPAIVRAQANKGVALVIGNSKYKWEASLPNAKRDAVDIAKCFQGLGLKTELMQDVEGDALRARIERFSEGCRGAEFAALYFAGHGASWDKDTYLVPVDTDLSTQETVRTLLPVTAVSAAMKEAAHRLLVFDNCRNNPADGWRQREAAFMSRIAATELAAASLHGPNTLVLFSTAPGRVAVDGPAGENSPFASAFLRKLSAPTIDLQSLAADLRRDLLIATEGRQVLWDQSTYDRPFILNGPRNRSTPHPVSAIDQVRIVALAKAYEFAREKQLLLPAGLVAVRASADSLANQKVGSYQTTAKMQLGNNTDNLYSSLETLLVIILSVASDGSAEVICSGRDWWASNLGGSAGKVWRYTSGTLSGSTLTFVFGRMRDQRTFKWSDANSGTNSAILSGVAASTPFKRLDG